MKKQTVLLGILCFGTAFAQKAERDTLKFQEIEDVKLHKHGNPNKARSFTAKGTIDIIENPQPIQMVTHEIIEQQQAKQLSDVIKNVNGIYITSSRGGSQDSFGGRGFTFGNDNIFKNGSRVNSGVFPEVSGLERVEVLKGANALLYGNVGPGGVVNMITKKPRFEFGGMLGLSAGSWNSFKPTVDFYGPLTEKIAFRVNGSYEYADSFRDVVHSEKYYFNPSFAFNIGENTQIIVEGDYIKQSFTPDFGLGTKTNSKTGLTAMTDLGRSVFLGEDWNYQTNQQATTDIILNHKFNEKWQLNAVAAYQNYTKDYFSVERVIWAYTDASPEPKWTRALNRSYNEQNYGSAQVNLNGEFYTGRIRHKILIGADGDYANADTYTFMNPQTKKVYGTSFTVGTWRLNDPSTWTHFDMPESTEAKRTSIPTQRFGVYIQDFVEISKMFKVIAGLRWSYVENKQGEIDYYNGYTDTTAPASKTVDRAFSPKAGVVFTPTENFSVYGTYTNSFVPNSGLDLDYQPLKPSTVDQFEIGLKKNIINNTVAFNLNAYQIVNNNTYQTSATNTQLKEYAGKVRSRGVELDITGNPNQQLTLVGGVSYNHSVYTETPDGFGYVENQRLVRTPATTANASVFYKFNKFAKGIVVGASGFYTGSRKGGWNDTKNQTQTTRMFDLKGYATADISLGYEHKKFLIQGKVGNLFDAENWNVHENYSINPITPRNFYVTVSYKL